MENACYSTDGILSLGGDEPHLKECPTCLDRFARRELFFRDLTAADQTMSFAARAHRAAVQGREMVARLRSATREERSREIGALSSPHPALAVCFCDESKRLLFSSPNDAEEWLRLAETLFSTMPPPADKWEKRDHTWAEAKMRSARGNLFMFRGSTILAHKEFEAAREIYETVGDEFQSALTARGFAFTWTKLGQPLKAKDICLRSLDILTAYGSVRDRIYLLNNLALVHLALSDHRKAKALFDHLCASLPADHPYVYTIRRNAILPFLEMKEYEEARRRLEALNRDLAGTDLDVEKALTQFMKAEIFLLTSETSRAESECRAVLNFFIRLDLRYDEAETRVLLGKACSDLGRFDEARGQIQQALAFYAGQGFAVELVKTLEEWTAAVERKDLSDRAFHTVRAFNRLMPPPPSDISHPSHPTPLH